MDTLTHPAHRRRLLDLARALLGTAADAEDVVQDAYLRWRGTTPPSLVSPEAWLMTVVKRLAIDRLRRRRLEHEAQALLALEGAGSAPPAEQLASQALDSAAAVRRIAATLSPHEAAMLLLREVFDADYAEIAQSAGRPEATCRQLVRRAAAKLRAVGVRRRHDDDADEADALFRICLDALRACDARPLHALLGRPAVTAQAPHAAVPAVAAAPHAHCMLAQVDGRYAMVLVQDGVVLCTLPVGACDAGEPACRIRSQLLSAAAR